MKVFSNQALLGMEVVVGLARNGSKAEALHEKLCFLASCSPDGLDDGLRGDGHQGAVAFDEALQLHLSVRKQVIVQGEAVKVFQPANVEAEVVELEDAPGLLVQPDLMLGTAQLAVTLPLTQAVLACEHQALGHRPFPQRDFLLGLYALKDGSASTETLTGVWEARVLCDMICLYCAMNSLRESLGCSESRLRLCSIHCWWKLLR